MSGSSALVVEGIVAGYSGSPVINGVSFSVDHGEVVALLGANGAGKSTLAHTVMGLLRPRAGTVALAGEEVTRLDVRRRVRRGLSLVTEGRDLFPQMRVEENLTLGTTGARAGGRDHQRALDDVLTLFPVLQNRMHQRAGTLSGGEQQMLALGRALMNRPTVMILDEPSLGLAPLVIEEILGRVRQLADTGVAVLLIEQNAHLALEVADRGLVMALGQVELAGTATYLAHEPTVRAAYFGEGFDV